MRPKQRLLHAFGLSPLVTFPVTMCVVAVWQLGRVLVSEMPMNIGRDLKMAFALGLVMPGFAYPMMLVVGVPVSFALRKLDLFRPGVMALAGGLDGLADLKWWCPISSEKRRGEED